MNITIEGYDGREPKLLADAIARAWRWDSETATIICRSREASGFCEYLLVLPTITIGCIQRKVAEPTEFHS